ncbi:hypothetical protein [Leptospira stimsonii]|uniref:hypothetical protein n=1 Tax=Leptospira stimsonii TaxID=2202203 RepID=UPI0019D5AE8F|nr:hypothetical protein [Leptospira stimsonii]
MIPPPEAEMCGVPAKIQFQNRSPLPIDGPVDPVSFVGQKNSGGSEAYSFSGIDVIV